VMSLESIWSFMLSNYDLNLKDAIISPAVAKDMRRNMHYFA